MCECSDILFDMWEVILDVWTWVYILGFGSWIMQFVILLNVLGKKEA